MTKKQAIIRALKEGAQQQLKINKEHNPSEKLDERLIENIGQILKKSRMKEAFNDYQFSLERLIEEASKELPDPEELEHYCNEADKAKSKVLEEFNWICDGFKIEGKHWQDYGEDFDRACVKMPIVYDLFDEEHADEPNPSH